MSGFVAGGHAADANLEPLLISNHDGHTMYYALRNELETSRAFDMSVAFVAQGAIQSLKQSFLNFADRNDGAAGRIITSTFNHFNAPAAFRELLQLHRNTGIDVRVWDPRGHEADERTRAGHPFHPKGYVFRHGTADASGSELLSTYIGSSNLTGNALTMNREWNLRVASTGRSGIAGQLEEEIREQIEQSIPLTEDWIGEYAEEYRRYSLPATADPRDGKHSIEPNAMQREALANLARLRQQGERRAIVISATGTGKTYLSAFDVRACHPRRMLYLAHQEQILKKSMSSYQNVLGCAENDLGLFTGTTHDADRRFLFATVQTLSRPDVLSQFPADRFDYILIDEVHHAAAASYRRIIDHFHPGFLLGMTATPERTDGENIFDLFGNNVAYEIRLQRALDLRMLCPFHYYGVHEYLTDGDEDSDGNGRRFGIEDPGNRADLERWLERLTSPERVRYIVDALQIYGQADVPVRGLMFCSRRDEAHRLSELLNHQFNQQAERLYRTRAIDGGTPQNERQQAVDDLENGRLDYLLTVDLFNEGIDIPSINQIVMLRQTQSSIIFTQQLGRGLRWAPGKDSVVVIDFIGNYATNYLIPIALYGNTGDRDVARRNMQKNVIGLSSISFDPIAQKKVLDSLATADLSNMTLLTDRYRDLRFELNRIPLLMDILNHDPSLVTTMAMKSRNYLAFVRSREASLGRKSAPRDMWLPGATTPEQEGVLTMLTAVLLRGLRPHEALALTELCGMPRDADGDDMPSGHRRLPSPVPVITDRGVTVQELHDHLANEFPTANDSDDQWRSALSVLEYTYFTAPNRKRFRNTPVIRREENDRIRLTDTLVEWIRGNDTFRTFFLDTLRASLANAHGLLDNLPRKDISACGFIRGEKYGIFDVMRLCGWPSEQVAQNVGGYRLDLPTSTLPIFIKYATSQYEDRFLDPSRILWYSKNNRNLRSPEYQWLLDGTQGTSAWTGTHIVPVFIRRKVETNETGYYFVGMASHIAEVHESVNRHESTNNRVVISTLTLDRPVPPDLLEHLTGTRTF